MSVPQCRSCGAFILWMKTKGGMNIPVDYATVPPDQGRQLVFDPEAGHIAHFATCPNADKHRKRK